MTKKTKPEDFFVEPVDNPFTTLEFVETNPMNAYIDADQRIGSVRIALRGKVPLDLVVYISENFANITPQNATWTFENRKVFCVFPRDQKILNPKKQTDKDQKKFQRLYLLFVTNIPDQKFQVQVTFPEEEMQSKRRSQAAEALSQATGGGVSAGDVKLPNNLLRAAASSMPEEEEEDDGLTMEEREEQAE